MFVMKNGDIVIVKNTKENLNYFSSQHLDVNKNDFFVVLDSTTHGLGLFLNKRTNKKFIAFENRFQSMTKVYDPNQEPEDDCL